MFQLLLVIIYLAFISLGLPDSLLGSAWPTMYKEFQVPVSYAGILSMIISAGTIVSSLLSDRLTKKFGPGKITAVSVFVTAVALFGFSISPSFWMLCLFAIPYGLGAGCVDASLNNYVAIHYESRHMSWLHCMWGVGAATGPYIMGAVLMLGKTWNTGYLVISILQVILTVILFVTLPLWQKNSQTSTTSNLADGDFVEAQGSDTTRALTLSQIFHIRGVKSIAVMFFCYCALEQTAGLWASSYLVLHKNISTQQATSFASLFFIGITVGRAISGFLTVKLSDTSMIRLGQGIILVGIITLLLPLSTNVSLIGFILIGLGCAPIYPCVIHSTPAYFGADRSQAIIGVQMASAYVGILAMPPLFGLIADFIHVSLLPVFLLIVLVVMVLIHEVLVGITNKKDQIF